MYLQNIVCVAPVLHSQIVRTNIVTNIDTHTQTNKHTGWKHYHLANAGDNQTVLAVGTRVHRMEMVKMPSLKTNRTLIYVNYWSITGKRNSITRWVGKLPSPPEISLNISKLHGSLWDTGYVGPTQTAKTAETVAMRSWSVWVVDAFPIGQPHVQIE